MKKLLQLFCLCLFVTASYGQGKIGHLSFVTGGTSSSNNLNPQTGPIEANFKDVDLTNMTLSRGAGLTYTNNSTYSYVGLLPAGGTRAAALTDDVYYELKLNASSKYMYISNLVARLRTADAWTSADIAYRWFYRVGNTGSFIELGAADVVLGFTNTNGDIEPAIDLSAITELQGVAPNTEVYFRLYAWGAKEKQADGVTDVTSTSRGFGFGKSSATTTEVLTIGGFLTDGAPVMASWNFTGVNADTHPTPAVTSAYQQAWVKKSASITALDVARGAGLEKASLSNAYAVFYKSQVLADIPANLAEAVAKETYYSVEMFGHATDYTQLLGYRMKLRGNATTATHARWRLLIGDNNNDISPASPIIELNDADINIASNADGVYFYLSLPNNNFSAVIPPNKKAELRLYVWGGTSTTGVYGLGRLANETHLQLYGKTLTAAQYLQVLPVTLSSFKSFKKINTVQLSWNTTSEQNNSHFNILRAGEDRNFVSVARVDGSGTSSTSRSYSVTDYKPNAGANYYKLSQTDLSGATKEIGEVQYVSLDLSTSSLTVLQNTDQSAVKALLNVNKSENATVSVYNVSGSVLYKKLLALNRGVNEISLPVSLNKGVYVLQLKAQSGEVLQAKFVR